MSDSGRDSLRLKASGTSFYFFFLKNIILYSLVESFASYGSVYLFNKKKKKKEIGDKRGALDVTAHSGGSRRTTQIDTKRSKSPRSGRRISCRFIYTGHAVGGTIITPDGGVERKGWPCHLSFSCVLCIVYSFFFFFA